jgi:7,8-dihydro-6-hydroxymethylpterin-pyrophosphokinase
MRSERLSVPHEQATSRRFVLIPLVELDREARTPDGTRLADRLAELPVDEGVRYAGPPLLAVSR